VIDSPVRLPDTALEHVVPSSNLPPSGRDMSAHEAYERMSAHYDLFTSLDDYPRWTAILDGFISLYGNDGRRLLDVGCGTGKSTLAFLDRGYDVTGCDISPAMIALARRKRPNYADHFHVSDMRYIDGPQAYDVITCMDDPLNYLCTRSELRSAFRGAHSCLVRGGVYVFDLNTLATYRTTYATTSYSDMGDAVFVREGLGSVTAQSGSLNEARLDCFYRDESVPENDLWRRDWSFYRQRHFGSDSVVTDLQDVGFQVSAIYGLHVSGAVSDRLDEEYHTKAIYVAQRSTEGGD